MTPPLIVEDYYAVLEVTQDADIPAIKASYRRLAKLTHPDKATADPDAHKNMQLVRLTRPPPPLQMMEESILALSVANMM
jgi:hypothetical protein